jgi:hypothetical protein
MRSSLWFLNQDLQDFEDYARSWEQFYLERAAA